MTLGWTLEPGGPRRRRRAALALGLVAIFGASMAAGWAATGATGNGAGTGLRPVASVATPTPTPIASAPGPATTATAVPGPTASTPPVPSSGPSTPSPSPSPTSTSAPTVPPELAARLDGALAAAQKSLVLPGVQATVIFADGSTWTGVRGLADVTARRKVTPSTPFAIASVSKTFTAALVLRLVDRGIIRLDDRLSRWLPDWPNAGHITIRMLLNHTSGIPDFFKNPKLDAALNRDKKRVWTTEEVLKSYVPVGMVFPPGKGWAYSNTNFALLGLVAEKAGGDAWARLVRRELLDPLGLSSTYVQVVEQPAVKPARAYRMIAGSRGPTPLARTDGTDVVPFTSVATAAGPAGAIASTTQDLARWARALYGGGVLTDATRRQMLTFVKAYSYGLVTSYGLGVSRVRFQGRIAYGHTGALTGTRASIRYFPREKVAIAVLFNRESFVGDDVVRILARVVFPAAAPAPSPGPSTRPSSAP